MLRKLCVSLFFVYATAVVSLPAAAQVPGIGLRLVPKVGLYRANGDLTDGFRAKDHMSFGGALELDLPLFPIDIRANVDHVNATDIELGGVRAGTVSITSMVGDLMLRPLPGIIPVQPYLFAGGGLKQYRFRDFSTSSFDSSNDRRDPTLHVGAGVGLNLLSMGLVVEVGDYVSRFKFSGATKTQNDLYGTVGVKIGLF
ncbi:MAG: hypothetical protein ABIV28_08430 [Longimicrobiales bacterium]